MKFRLLMTATAFTLASALSAWGACAGHSQQVMSCAEGMVWDQETKTCVPLTSS